MKAKRFSREEEARRDDRRIRWKYLLIHRILEACLPSQSSHKRGCKREVSRLATKMTFPVSAQSLLLVDKWNSICLAWRMHRIILWKSTTVPSKVIWRRRNGVNIIPNRPFIDKTQNYPMANDSYIACERFTHQPRKTRRFNKFSNIFLGKYHISRKWTANISEERNPFWKLKKTW